VTGLPVPLSGLRRTAEIVWSTRLQTFWTVPNFHPLLGYHWKWWFSRQVLAFNTQKLDMVKTMSTHGKINAIWWNFKIKCSKIGRYMWIWIANKFAKCHTKRLNGSENIPKSFRGAIFKHPVVCDDVLSTLSLTVGYVSVSEVFHRQKCQNCRGLRFIIHIRHIATLSSVQFSSVHS